MRLNIHHDHPFQLLGFIALFVYYSDYYTGRNDTLDTCHIYKQSSCLFDSHNVYQNTLTLYKLYRASETSSTTLNVNLRFANPSTAFLILS